jgi:serine/threonine protein kinase
MAQQANHPLPNGYRLEEYTIERQLSLGGFSIVYLAADADGRQVAIKEYLPNSLALRGEGETRPNIDAEHLGAFRYGMKCFFEEGRSLARLSHPNVIRVLNFFRANDTVSMVMPYEEGRRCRNTSRGTTGNFRTLHPRRLHAHADTACAKCMRTSCCTST